MLRLKALRVCVRLTSKLESIPALSLILLTKDTTKYTLPCTEDKRNLHLHDRRMRIRVIAHHSIVGGARIVAKTSKMELSGLMSRATSGLG